MVFQRNSERLRAKVYQNRVAQEFREALTAHSVARAPGCLFKKHAGGKVSKKDRHDIKTFMLKFSCFVCFSVETRLTVVPSFDISYRQRYVRL